MPDIPSMVPVEGARFTAHKIIFGCRSPARDIKPKQRVFSELPNYVVEPFVKVYVARVIRPTPGAVVPLEGRDWTQKEP